jgi:ribosome-associated toxin RatA of RatAB toxin-antitoxin module
MTLQPDEPLDLSHMSADEFLGESADVQDFDNPATQEVQIEAQVVAQRERLITARLFVPAPCTAERLWQVLTHYEALADFIPNLSVSQRLPHPTGGIRLEQVGVQKLLKISFKARVVLDLTEYPCDRIDFTMVEGDFQTFTGAWQLEPMENGVYLAYHVTVIPKRTLPIQLIEGRICKDLPVNLLAIRDRAQALSFA